MNTDRAQVASLSTSARAYLVTLETMRRMVDQATAERAGWGVAALLGVALLVAGVFR